VIIAPGVTTHGQVVIDSRDHRRPLRVLTIRDGRSGQCGRRKREAIVYGPTLGKRVQVGTGAKLLGPISVGDGAHIGANAVVLQDVPVGATAVGVPARVILPGEHLKAEGP
jgi:acetyltransferase-like isoleucine patch superfamily enzyme